MNKLTSISALLPAVVLAAGTVSAAGPAEWVQPAGDDLRVESLPASTPAVPPSRHVESQPVSYAWPLTIDDSASAPSGPAMESRLQLTVPADLLLASDLAAPFEVREVRLLDQGRMAVLESRSRGFTIDRDSDEPRRPFDTINQ